VASEWGWTVTARRSGVALLAVAVCVLAACTQGVDTDAPSPTSPTGEAGEDTPAEVILGDTAPLTGLPFGDENLNRPSLAAKVDNHPAARPQIALDRADIVFEELVEGGLTRYVAIWHSDLPPEIGPVRSVRPMDPDIVSPFGGILAYSGGQQRFIEAMLRAPVESAIHGQSNANDFFYRSPDKVAPHNVIVRAVELVANFADKAPPKQQFAYAATPELATAVVSGDQLAGFSARFSSFQAPSWDWSAEEGAFLRSQTNGLADVALSGQRVAATNVVSIFVDIQVIQDIPTTFLVGSGSGFVATGGHIISVTWSKESPEAVIELRDATGQEVTLAPGITWVELLPAPGSGVPAGEVVIK
jgi:hypothetical protein